MRSYSTRKTGPIFTDLLGRHVENDDDNDDDDDDDDEKTDVIKA